MIEEAKSKAVDMLDYREIRKIYGHPEDLIHIINEEITEGGVKEIYEILLGKVIHKNGSFLPSMNERKTNDIK